MNILTSIKAMMAALATTTAFTATAAPINLDFAFGDVSGTFYGLDDALAGSQAATSFDLHVRPEYSLGFQASFTGFDASFAQNNNFSFLHGSLVVSDFWFLANHGPSGVSSFTDDNGFWALDTLDFTGAFPGFPDAFAFYIDPVSNDPIHLSHSSVSFTIRPIAAVPLPASAVLLLSGLLGVAGLKRRKKHAA